MAKKKAAHIYINEDLLDRVQAEAARQHRNLSWQVEFILLDWMNLVEGHLDRDTPVASVQNK